MTARLGSALLIVCALATMVRADAPQPEAERLFAEGRELLLVKLDAKAACLKFEAVIHLDPKATGAMLNLGLCNEQLGKYATSIKWFRRAQASAAEKGMSEYEAAAKEHTVAISPKVPSVRLRVTPNNAQVEIDGAKIPVIDYGEIELDPGTHEIVARAPGKMQQIKTVTLVEAERERAIELALAEEAAPVYVDRGAERRRAAKYLALGGTGLLVLVGGYGFVEKHLYETGTSDTPRLRLRYVGTSLFVVGTAAVGTALWLYLSAPGKVRASGQTALAPLLADDQLGLTLSGAF